MGVALKLKLLKPYDAASLEVPDLEVEMAADASKLDWGDMHLTKIDALVHAIIDGANLNRSTVDIQRFDVVGRAMDFQLKGQLSELLSDPHVKGDFHGSISLDRLPRRLTSALQMSLSGRLSGDAAFDLRQSWLTPKKFHRVKLDGRLSLNDLRIATNDKTMDAYIRRATMVLGTNSRITAGEHLVDSMLTASLDIDTINMNLPGLHLGGRQLKAGVGSRNIATSADTTQINPIGGRITAGMLSLTADSGQMAVRLRDAVVAGSLKRYNNNARQPQLTLQVDASRIHYRDAEIRGSIFDGKAGFTLHPRARRAMSPRMQARVDSLAALYPELSTDSLRTLATKSFRRNSEPTEDDGRENIEFEIDNSLKAWLQAWQVHGGFKASRASFYTPVFPTRNRFSDVALEFSTDSVVVYDAKLRTAGSDFRLNGAIRNISRSLTSRRHSPISLDFNLVSDTINVNAISAALLRGAATAGGQTASNAALIAAVEEADDDDPIVEVGLEEEEIGAFVVPSNVRADFHMKANHILYGDLWLRDFQGNLNMWDGAISLEELSASTDLGAMKMTALYSAPTRDDIRFAAGMNLQKLQLSQIIKEIPKLDSIMPMLKDVDGVVDARLALTSELDTSMNLKMNTIGMALNLSGDSLVLLDSETFRTVAKWMMFKNKKRNMIDHMDVEVIVRDGYLDLYPVVFDMDRYRIGVVGNNDMDFNLDYHVAVLKSPLPFKFGINIKGTPEKMKIRLGKARLNEKSVASSRNITNEARVNLITEMRNMFRRGVRHTGSRGLRLNASGRRASAETSALESDTISRQDSLLFIQQGLIAAPPKPEVPDNGKKSKKKKK